MTLALTITKVKAVERGEICYRGWVRDLANKQSVTVSSILCLFLVGTRLSLLDQTLENAIQRVN
jgi:hypothetical protein